MRPTPSETHVEDLLADPRLGPAQRDLVRHIGHRVECIVEVKGRAYLRLYESRCKVCRSPYRDLIEANVRANTWLYGLGSSRGIVARLPEGHGVSWRSIRRHTMRRHDPVITIARQAAIDARAQQLGPVYQAFLEKRGLEQPQVAGSDADLRGPAAATAP